ncbi:retropepsin-like aspartic protease family protein [Sphingomonas aracearum]|uniref:TIGR02281 family clan AA aspartic protease n=1 Tax=Sphingomonas aracearum TaxID=2283317 RepID=A0A369VRQ2_9SPHN|nr:TIGR02281 family clan AA aspartic protease [Sphingomonas aracearum]RDE05058.1 TIGR02281 family clan AA aspartic protease [Sphingomonas aracearum]
MSGGTVQAILLALLLVLPLANLIGRRVPLASVVTMALAWIAIFALALVLVSGRDRYRAVWDGGKALLFGPDQTVSGGAVRIAMSDDGHFYADVQLNGVSRRMLIDSGATATAVSQATARAAGIEPQDAFPTMVETANGMVTADRASVRDLRLGGITARDLPIVVSPAFGDLDVIGMNFLSRLKGWRVEGRTLILEPFPTTPA